MKGVRKTATTTIHKQKLRSNPTQVEKMDCESCAMSTMKTHPPPYKVMLMHSKDNTLKIESIHIRVSQKNMKIHKVDLHRLFRVSYDPKLN